MPYCFSRSSIKLQGHRGKKSPILTWIGGFTDCNSSFNSLMALKWCTKLNIVLKRCPIVFHGHLSNFKVTGDKKSPILTQIGRIRTVTPDWIHGWLWNDAQSLMLYWRGALLFFTVIYQISRSQGTKNSQSILTQIGRFRTVTPDWIQ